MSPQWKTSRAIRYLNAAQGLVGRVKLAKANVRGETVEPSKYVLLS